MAYGITLIFEGVTEDQYWQVNDELGIDRNGEGDYPDGLRIHVGGSTGDGGWIVSEVWDDQATQEAFMAGRLGAALAAVGVPPPAQVIESETVNEQTR